MKRSEMCDCAAEAILSGEWRDLSSSDPMRRHIDSCSECQSRIQQVWFFGEAFSSDDPKVGLKRKPTVSTPLPFPIPKSESKPTWVKPLVKVFSYAAAACFFAVLVWNIFQPEGVGRVAALEGEATIRRFGDRSTVRLSEGSRIFEGDLVRTNAGSKVCLQLEETNYIHLNESTEIRMEGTRLLHHNTGETWFEIAKGSGEFEIETRGADVLVLGTSFGVQYREDEVRVPVSSGRVRLLTKGGEIELDPGHVGVYSSLKPYMPPTREKELYTESRPPWLLIPAGDMKK